MKGVSTGTGSAFGYTKSSSGMGGKPNACMSHVAAPHFVKLTQSLLVLEHMGEVAKGVVLTAALKVCPMQAYA